GPQPHRARPRLPDDHRLQQPGHQPPHRRGGHHGHSELPGGPQDRGHPHAARRAGPGRLRGRYQQPGHGERAAPPAAPHRRRTRALPAGLRGHARDTPGPALQERHPRRPPRRRARGAQDRQHLHRPSRRRDRLHREAAPLLPGGPDPVRREKGAEHGGGRGLAGYLREPGAAHALRKETGESERRAVPYGEGVRQRRRPRWAEFREAYPRIVTAMALGLVALIALDAWVLYKRVSFRRETARLRSSMSEVEKKRADTIVAAAEGRVALQVELVRRRALGDPSLNLAVAVDEGKMFLQREGARLREMRVQVGPEATMGDAPDAVRLAAPRGQRTVLRAVDASYRWEAPAWVYAQR